MVCVAGGKRWRILTVVMQAAAVEEKAAPPAAAASTVSAAEEHRGRQARCSRARTVLQTAPRHQRAPRCPDGGRVVEAKVAGTSHRPSAKRGVRDDLIQALQRRRLSAVLVIPPVLHLLNGTAENGRLWTSPWRALPLTSVTQQAWMTEEPQPLTWALHACQLAVVQLLRVPLWVTEALVPPMVWVRHCQAFFLAWALHQSMMALLAAAIVQLRPMPTQRSYVPPPAVGPLLGRMLLMVLLL